MEQYLEQFIALADGAKLSVLVATVIANLILGIATSIYTKTFRLKLVADFLVSKVLPYLISYMAVAIVAVVEPSWKAAVTVVWGLIIVALAGAILTNLREMGINLPDFLGGEKQ